MAEISIEEVLEKFTAPDLLKALGFDRLSMGVQSLNDKELKVIGRIHTAQQALDTIKAAQKAGFKRINADVMTGLPAYFSTGSSSIAMRSVPYSDLPSSRQGACIPTSTCYGISSIARCCGSRLQIDQEALS